MANTNGRGYDKLYFCEWFGLATLGTNRTIHRWSDRLGTTLCAAVGGGVVDRARSTGECLNCSQICFVKWRDVYYVSCGCDICRLALTNIDTHLEEFPYREPIARGVDYRSLLHRKHGIPITSSPTKISIGHGPESPVEVQLHDAMTRLGIAFVNQHPVDNYRLDFAIVRQQIAIEVDGHQFHQRTKAQALHDKRRDRKLLALGWRTLRFTGSEVFHGADRCAQEIARFLESAA